MAIRLEINNADGLGLVDYTRYIASPEQSVATLRDRMNEPSLFDFTLQPADDNFAPPRRSAYVRLTGLAGALTEGELRIPGPIFTGFITSEPEMEFVGVRSGAPVHIFRCQATSEEYLLNIKRIGVLPPFLNQTAGQVLKRLTEYRQPGRFDTSGIADGVFLPDFAVSDGRNWSEVARELAERAGYSYVVLDGKIFFQRVSALSAGVIVDETDSRFRPDALEITPLANPIHNDVTIFGEVEPQALVQEYFVGDGFTSRFVLAVPVFGAGSSRLLADDFTAGSIDTTRWIETDPDSHITSFEGRLNVTGGTGTLGEATLLAQEALELAGELELIHGEFEFVSSSVGIIGGLYDDAELTQEHCLVGIEAAPFNDTTRLRSVIAGVIQPTEVIVDPVRHYVLITRLSANQQHRTLQTFTSLDEIFGGASLPADIKVTLEIREINPEDAADVQSLVIYESTLTNLPAYAFYAPISSADLHLVMNFLQVTQPIQAQLETQLLGGLYRRRTLGFGIAGHDATITSDAQENQWALEFYEDTIPAPGEKISLRYRAAGSAQARVRVAASVLAEAVLTGDDGVRTVALRDLRPAPRTSAEAESAARAYLADHLLPAYEGRYTTWGDFVDHFPRSGTVLDVHHSMRYPEFAAIVRSVTSEFRELAAEKISHTLEFGQPARFEDLLRRFAPSERVLSPEEPELPAVDSENVGSSFIEEIQSVQLVTTSPVNFTVAMAASPPDGGQFEIRRGDQGWRNATQSGTPQNLLFTATQSTFLIPRTARRHTFFIRPVDAEGRTSRYSTVLGIQFPLPPLPPLEVSILFGEDATGKPIITVGVVIGEGGLVDVDLVELRDSDEVTVLTQWSFGQLRREGSVYRAEHVLDNSVTLLRSKTLFVYTQNTLGEHSIGKSATGFKPEPTKPTLSVGNSVGQVLEIGLDRLSVGILQTQIQVVGPGSTFTSPDQDVTLDGQPEKFGFVATSAGGWAFRARRRDALGWTPWSNEQQGQLGPQVLLFLVQFLQAPELDPSIGAAINGQNLLPNSEFFLPGISGQEGTHAPRHYKLVNAVSDGSEVDYLVSTNEVQWKSSVNFAGANPGFRSLLSNLGRTLNPGEPVTLSAALRHSGTLPFGLPVCFALRSPAQPGYDRTADIPSGKIGTTYQWFSATFTLPTDQAVPADLSVEIAAAVPSGQALSTSLFCDKVILNRGHRPGAFTLAPWDVVALAWNPTTQSYSLPATGVADTPRTTDPGNAGSLSGTGTDDADANFANRFFRILA